MAKIKSTTWLVKEGAGAYEAATIDSTYGGDRAKEQHLEDSPEDGAKPRHESSITSRIPIRRHSLLPKTSTALEDNMPHSSLNVSIESTQSQLPEDTEAKPIVEDIHNDQNTERDEAEREDGIRTAIAYARSQAAACEPSQLFSQFRIEITNPPSTSLTLLRHAAAAGLATLIASHYPSKPSRAPSPTFEVYAIPSPPIPCAFQAIDSQWWRGLSRGEMRAGPLRSQAETRQADYEAKRQLKRKQASSAKTNGRFKVEREIMGEGLRRQILGLPMSGRLEKEDVEAAMREKGHLLKWDDFV